MNMQTFRHPDHTPPYQIKLRGENIDRVYGIERDSNSPVYGRLVVPAVLLWKRPESKLDKINLSGALNHGDEVDIIRTTQYKGEFWRFVEARVVVDGKAHLQRGWVLERMLETAGARHYENKHLT